MRWRPAMKPIAAATALTACIYLRVSALAWERGTGMQAAGYQRMTVCGLQHSSARGWTLAAL